MEFTSRFRTRDNCSTGRNGFISKEHYNYRSIIITIQQRKKIAQDSDFIIEIEGVNLNSNNEYVKEETNYIRIARVIDYINEHHKDQPTLDELADHVALSPFHFQRLFTDWVGISPKQFLQYVTLNYAKSLLKKQELTLFDTSHETGLSSTSRLHDLFIKIEGMTPAEFKNKGSKLHISYSFYESKFGLLILASTTKGLCFMQFIDNNNQGLDLLKNYFSNAFFLEQVTDFHEKARSIYSNEWTTIKELKLHLKGTEFQLKVWESLLKIPIGDLTTYSKIANNINKPKASRAVGTAIGNNPVALLIPCHRVIQASGSLGGYMWGTTRKQVIIGWEAVQIKKED